MSPDLIVMDVMMPKKDGVEAFREIMESLPETRMIMLTASTEANAVIEAVAAGAAGYLLKVLAGMDQVLGMMKSVASAGEACVCTKSEVVEAGLRQDSGRGEIEGRQPDPEGDGDTLCRSAGAGHTLRLRRQGESRRWSPSETPSTPFQVKLGGATRSIGGSSRGVGCFPSSQNGLLDD